MLPRSRAVFPGWVIQPWPPRRGGGEIKGIQLQLVVVVGEKGKSRERKERSRGLVESGLVLIFSGATTCHRDHLALDMPVDTLPGGNINRLCSEILYSCRWGLKTSAVQMLGQ